MLRTLIVLVAFATFANAVPAPKSDRMEPANALVGAWALNWGAIEQTTFLYADGTCFSPEYGGGCGLRMAMEQSGFLSKITLRNM